jgi:hypothetical protein
MEVTLRARTPRLTFETLSDATNYLGGIADVLEAKGHRAAYIAHLGDLGNVAVYDNDSQLRDVRLVREDADSDGYTVRLWAL